MVNQNQIDGYEALVGIKPGESGSIENPLKTNATDEISLIQAHSISHENNGAEAYFNWLGGIFSINDAFHVEFKKGAEQDTEGYKQTLSQLQQTADRIKETIRSGNIDALLESIDKG